MKYFFKLWVVLLLITELTLTGIGFCGHTHHSHSEDKYAHADIHEAFPHVITCHHDGGDGDAPETSHCQPIFHCPCHNGTLGITSQFCFSPIVQFETYFYAIEFTSYPYWRFPLERPPLAFC